MNTTRMAGLLAYTALAGPNRAFADLNFDATTVTPDTGFDALPAGWYNVHIDESEKKPTAVKPGETESTGWYLKVRFHVIDGQYAGRKVYTNLNLKNDSAQAVEIAQKQLSAICHAVGVLKPQKSEELHGKPLKVKLKYKPAAGNYGEGNEITSYKPITEQVDMAGGDAGAAAFGAGAPKAPEGFGAGAAAAASGAPTEPWATGAAAAVAGSPVADPPAQPWAQPQAGAPAPAVPQVPAAPVPVHDPIAAATANGWVQHPASPPHMYKGQEVKTKEEVAGMYPPPAAPTVPEVPAAPAVPAVPAAPAPATGAPSEPAATQAAPPPWAVKA